MFCLGFIPCLAEHVINEWVHEFAQVTPPAYNNTLFITFIGHMCVMCV